MIKNYEKEILKTSVDASKLAKGVYGNFIVRAIMEGFYESADFAIKFPMRKVRSIFNNYSTNFLLSHFQFRNQGIYKTTNQTISDEFIPIQIITKFSLRIRFVGKLVGGKTAIHLFTLQCYGRAYKVFV